MAIYATSDLHIGHNRQFVYKPRGFASIDEMNEAIVQRWNETVTEADEVYVLGDLMLNDNEAGMRILRRLRGHLHIVCGNHDTDARCELYKTLPNVIEVADALRLKYNGYHFFMTHYPCFTANLEKETLKQCTCNLFGHTHQTSNFYNDIPFMYHVGVDSHNCTPVLLDTIISEMEAKVIECKQQL